MRVALPSTVFGNVGGVGVSCGTCTSWFLQPQQAGLSGSFLLQRTRV